MSKFFSSLAVSSVLLLSMSGVAFAANCDKGKKTNNPHCQPVYSDPALVPEIDAAAGGTALAILLASLTLVWARRRA